MKWYHWLAGAGVVVAVAAGLTVLLLKLSQPYALEQWEEDKRNYPDVDHSPPVIEKSDLVQHPITGEWITPEQAEREAKVLRAILCNQGRTEYC